MIRHAEYNDIPQLKKLWTEAFGEEPDYMDEFFAQVFRPVYALCEVRGNRPVAMLYKLPCTIVTAEGLPEPAYYFYALATDKAYRGMGIMTRLIETAQKEIHSEGCRNSFLIPAEESLASYYGRFGFFRTDRMSVWEMPAQGMTAAEKGLNLELRSLEDVKDAQVLRAKNWKITNSSVRFSGEIQEFCLNWSLREEHAVFYEIVCEDQVIGFVYGKSEDAVLQISDYGLDGPYWPELKRLFGQEGYREVLVTAAGNPDISMFRKKGSEGGFPVSVRTGQSVPRIHGLLPI